MALLVFAIVLGRDLLRNREAIGKEPGRPAVIATLSPVIMFLASMGISDFVMNTLLYRKLKLVDDKRLPGTLVTASTLPLGIIAVGYILAANVDFRIVLVCMVAQTFGAILGVRIVSGFDGRLIKKIVAIAMLASAAFLVVRMIASGNENAVSTTFSTPKLVLTGVCAFLLGIGNMIGMGAKAPYLTLFLMLGLSADGVLAIIMPSCTMSSLFGGIQYIRKGLYQRKIALLSSVFGLIGIMAGFVFVSNVPQTALQIIMLAIAAYTGISMLLK